MELSSSKPERLTLQQMDEDKCFFSSQGVFATAGLLQSTPSIVDDNMTVEEERQHRYDAVRFVQEAGAKLEFPVITTSTAAVLLHRFYCRRSFKTFDKYLMATTCIYLAAKLEESPKKLRDVINTTYNVQHKTPLKIGQEYWDLRDAVVQHEQILVRTLAFDLVVEHPYKYILNYLKSLRAKYDLAQVAWNIINDSFCTTICLLYRPNVVAVTAIYLAATMLNITLPSGPHKMWWEVFDVSLQQIEEISVQVLELYEKDTIPTIEVGDK